MAKIEQMVIERKVEKPEYSETIEIPVKNGHGHMDKDVPREIVTKNRLVTGTIIAPDRGTWHVIVTNTQKTVNFDERGLKRCDKRSINYTKRLGKDTVTVDVYWENEDRTPIKEDTTFKAKIES